MSNKIIKELVKMLEEARHTLVSYQGLFASDLHWQDRLPHLENGTQVEFQIYDPELLQKLDEAIEKGKQDEETSYAPR